MSSAGSTQRQRRPATAGATRLDHRVLLVSPFFRGEARGNGSTAHRTQLRLEEAGAQVQLVRSDPELCRAAIEGFRPHVLHGVHAVFTARALAGVEYDGPLVLTIGGNDVHTDLTHSASPAIDLLRRADVCVAATPEEQRCAEALRTRPGAAVLLVPRFPVVGHEPLEGCPPRNGEPVVAWCGAMRWQKRPEWVLEIHRRLRSRLPELVTRVAGPDPRTPEERRWYEALSSEPGMQRSVTFDNGHGGSAGSFLAQVDVVLNTSRIEGQSNFLLEAIHEGVPVVATRAPGNRSWIEHGSQGLLYEEIDEAVDLIASLLLDAQARSALSRTARAWLDTHASPDLEREGLTRAHRIALGLE